jgi:hypothetical protein
MAAGIARPDIFHLSLAHSGRAANRLLSGDDIATAKDWVERRPKGAPEPTSLQLDFIKASEAEALRQQSVEAKRLLEIGGDTHWRVLRGVPSHVGAVSSQESRPPAARSRADRTKKIRTGLACYARARLRATHRVRPAAVASLTSTRLPE